MFKNIIPNLVSFETTLNKLPGFYFSDNFQFYSQIEEKSPFHYKVFVDNNIVIPQKYDFRNGYFTKSGSKWYYERKLGFLSLRFCYDPTSKTFSFNKLYFLIPFEIGQIFPVGLHISDFINLDLFLSGVITFKGCAFQYQQNTICIVAPSYNGKTTVLKNIFDKGGKYIAEDILVLDPYKNIVYPSNIRTDIFARKVSKNIKNFHANKSIIKPQNIKELFLVQNSTNLSYICQNKNIFDFLNICSLGFSKNSFLRSYIFEELLTYKVEDKLEVFKKGKIKYSFKHAEGFNYDFLEQ